MPVRTAYAPVAASVLTAANLAKLPGGWIGYAEATSNQTGISAEVDVTSLTVTVTVGTSRRIRITTEVSATSTVGGDVVVVRIREGAAELQSRRSAISSGDEPITASVVLTPTSGSHTYKTAIGRNSGTGTLNTVATATSPVYILVEDIGTAT